MQNERVAFTFDERSLDALEDMTKEGNYDSMADTILESLQISRALQTQAKQGFSEIALRNPNTGEECVIIIPHLQALSQKK